MVDEPAGVTEEPTNIATANDSGDDQDNAMSATMNSWESSALEYQYPDTGQSSANTQPSTWTRGNSATDPLIYPGLYCPSGFDIMSILLRVMSRPNPQIHLGPIDASCALVLCDLQQPDQPIVYASDPFCQLTGYATHEILGRNCRFLQFPGGGGGVRRGSSRNRLVDRDAVRRVRRAVERNAELQVELVNFRKDGRRFVNLLSIVPVRWDESDGGYTYSVGFQCEMEEEEAGGEGYVLEAQGADGAAGRS